MPSPTRIAVVGTSPSGPASLGGVASYTRDLVDELKRLSVAPVIIAQRDPAPDDGESLPVWRRNRPIARPVLAALAGRNIDLIHMQHEPFLYGGPTAAFWSLAFPRAARKKGFLCVVTLHAVPFENLLSGQTYAPRSVRIAARLYLRALRFMSRSVDGFIVHEEGQLLSLSTFGRIPTDRIHVIPHGLHVTASRRKRAKGSGLVIGSFGFLTTYKDPQFLLDEFVRFRRHSAESTLLMSVSPHPRGMSRAESKRYADIMKKARAEKNVVPLGHIPDADLDEFVQGCDVVVVPHRLPVSVSGVAARAIGSGVPVILLKGTDSLSRHPGWSYEYRTNGLVEALVQHLANPNEMSTIARSEARTRQWSEIARRHRELYEQIIERGPSG